MIYYRCKEVNTNGQLKEDFQKLLRYEIWANLRCEGVARLLI